MAITKGGMTFADILDLDEDDFNEAQNAAIRLAKRLSAK